MKSIAKLLSLLVLCVTMLAHAQISSFTHVIVIVQENHTPDNLFQGLCTSPFGSSKSCSITPTGSQYNIQTSNWVDKTSSTGTTKPGTVALDNNYDPSHIHSAFTDMCDYDAETGACRNDGGANNACAGTCPKRPPYHYVTNTSSILNPYLTLATSYGFANYMFQTNQGPSFPSHQYLFGGTAAPSAADDANATFTAENMTPWTVTVAGCTAAATTTVELIDTKGENSSMYPCLEHQTMADLLNNISVSWKYYSSGAASIWTAPNAINHICVPSKPTGGKCTGTYWTSNVILNPPQILTDIGNCNLPRVSWVIPQGKNSDHPNSNTGGGPSWVASIANAIGTNPECRNKETYWNNTAILVTWDDWGGWFDHVPPPILAGAQGDYQYGFRVPLLVVSAYTPAAYIDNNRMDFGTLLRFLEHNYGIAEGALGFADARASGNLSEFFNLALAPRPFTTIPTTLDANYFINDKSLETDPDDD